MYELSCVCVRVYTKNASATTLEKYMDMKEFSCIYSTKLSSSLSVLHFFKSKSTSFRVSFSEIEEIVLNIDGRKVKIRVEMTAIVSGRKIEFVHVLLTLLQALLQLAIFFYL